MTTQHTMADPIHEAFAEHRKVLAQRDELVAALRMIAEWDHPSHPVFETAPVSVEALADIARAALAKVA